MRDRAGWSVTKKLTFRQRVSRTAGDTSTHLSIRPWDSSRRSAALYIYIYHPPTCLYSRHLWKWNACLLDFITTVRQCEELLRKEGGRRGFGFSLARMFRLATTVCYGYLVGATSAYSILQKAVLHVSLRRPSTTTVFVQGKGSWLPSGLSKSNQKSSSANIAILFLLVLTWTSRLLRDLNPIERRHAECRLLCQVHQNASLGLPSTSLRWPSLRAQSFLRPTWPCARTSPLSCHSMVPRARLLLCPAC